MQVHVAAKGIYWQFNQSWRMKGNYFIDPEGLGGKLNSGGILA